MDVSPRRAVEGVQVPRTMGPVELDDRHASLGFIPTATKLHGGAEAVTQPSFGGVVVDPGVEVHQERERVRPVGAGRTEL